LNARRATKAGPTATASLLRRVTLALLLTSGGCSSIPAPRLPACHQTPAPPISISPDGQTARLRLDVLTYNIEGLGWPARRGRASDLSEIGRRLSALREAGKGPDVVLFQEMFSRAAVSGVEGAGYPALVAGPSRKSSRALPAEGRTPGRRKLQHGEIGLRFASGGLAIASRYPIALYQAEPFSHRACAGMDCLSNKGAVHARIDIPGVPDPIELFNSHMNSKKASRASPSRTLASHQVQSAELAAFIGDRRNPDFPTVLGGDFNMRGSEERFGVFEPLQPLILVHRYCLETPSRCAVKMSWDGDAPWMDTQDLLFFKPGARVVIRPIAVEAMFDGRPESPVLSDHDGFRVVYELSWPVAAQAHGEGCHASRPLGS